MKCMCQWYNPELSTTHTHTYVHSNTQTVTHPKVISLTLELRTVAKRRVCNAWAFVKPKPNSPSSLKRLTVKRPSRWRSRNSFFSAFYEHVSLFVLPLLSAAAAVAYVISHQRFVALRALLAEIQAAVHAIRASRKSQVKCRKWSLVLATTAAKLTPANLANCTCRIWAAGSTANCPLCALKS